MKLLAVASILLVLLSVCALRPSGGGVAATHQKPNVHDLFDQYESMRFLNQDQPATADWAHVPWSGQVSSVHGFGEGVFVIGVKEGSEFWTVSEVESAKFNFTRLPMPHALNESYYHSMPLLDKWIIVDYQDISGSVMVICRVPNFEAGFDSAICATVEWDQFPADPKLATVVVFGVPNVTSAGSGGGAGFQAFHLRQMNVEYSTEALIFPGGRHRSPKNLYFASEGGLTYIPLPVHRSQGDVNARPVTLTNTTGGVVTRINATSVWCFPGHVPISVFNASARPDAFHQGQCYVGTANQVCLHNVCPPNLVHRILDGRETYFYRTPGIIDRLPNGLAYDAQRNAVHMGNDKCLNLLYANDSLWRVDGKTGGLPMNKIKSVSSNKRSYDGNDPHTIWYGTEQGVNVMLSDGKWRYFYGPRWLPVPPGTQNRVDGNFVTALAAHGRLTVIGTKTGLSVVSRNAMTLNRKAQLFQVQQDKYHDYHGLSMGLRLAQFGNLSSTHQMSTDNDGLWSSVYLQGQAFRYATETDPVLKKQAKRNAQKTFAGMKMLFNVTGIKGYPARGFKRSASSPGHHWNKSPTMPGYWYSSQTSSDEITGHMSAYPIYHDLVCETQAEKDDAKQVVADLMSHIVNHNNDLIGEDGKPTLWGRWSNHGVNNDPFYYDSRGLDSLQYMMMLSGGYHVTKNETYASVFIDLVENHGYSENAIHSKITQASDVDFSDDQLNFLSYLGLLWTSKLLPGSRGGRAQGNSSTSSKLFAKVQYDMLVSIERTFHYKMILREKSNWWNVIYAAFIQSARKSGGPNDRGGLSPAEEASLMGSNTGALFSFQTWPISWIKWPMNNEQRLDIEVSADDPGMMEHILPYDETNLLAWNNCPFALSGGSGTWLDSPSAWLTPYWTARYLGFLNSTQV